MSRFSRLDVYQTIRRVPVVPVFYHADAEVCREVLGACYRAGIRAFEFTNRGDFAHELFSELAKITARDYPDLVLGAGTLVEAATAALYIQSGANFIVGPSFHESIARICNRRKVAYMPGCATLTEISAAEEFGVEVVKAFPGDTLGPGFVKAVKGPMPWTSIMVTGGVEPTQASLSTWFGAGVTAVGIGSQLFPKDVLKNRQYDQIETKAREVIAIIDSLRSQ
ncbi:bifunctional 4-hydroxy-2-oxoglutarate aldolase/2-dehydro-3-deoxy-phosphogluconate aldolase [Larkinella terrae]|uniref:Bifunctional 4-hydroxy-2-oxoglutarate aldolase/2-dehydro-3-deoxy-phosphogluconate aldolase n=1 Tax=Larkinella terrae TaxID=2025311 RepID=A0A7K0EKL5_9BACT|nr:bifunctional 4-hydroxy-2-oxoglutarate aldolase/2-dehydro-3-deoxy-phosphogluconate aldolase [Larkinella terrae]MRS62400.1 bifunctional 4-hydroxy-2-oxoglutarate aldolase/2-dehydro-3-deoxy-phosphogluconate aldolase [Larkinella terrae]